MIGDEILFTHLLLQKSKSLKRRLEKKYHLKHEERYNLWEKAQMECIIIIQVES